MLLFASSRICLTELNGKHQFPLREGAHYGSTMSLRSLASDNSGICTSSIQNLDFSNGGLITLHDKIENHHTVRRRSPSLPPIHNNKEQYQHFLQVIFPSQSRILFELLFPYFSILFHFLPSSSFFPIFSNRLYSFLYFFLSPFFPFSYFFVFLSFLYFSFSVF